MSSMDWVEHDWTDAHDEWLDRIEAHQARFEEPGWMEDLFELHPLGLYAERIWWLLAPHERFEKQFPVAA